MHNQIKKIAAINDLTGFGRCALTVTIPIISAMGIQCCPVPTSLFSNHPGFSHFYSRDFTSHLPEYLAHWKDLNLTFDGILSGYLNSIEQISIVKQLITDFSTEHTKVIVDPVMGDNGHLYSIYTKEMCEAMKELASLAHILTPNLTEACLLADYPYHAEDWNETEMYTLMNRLQKFQAKNIVVSGIPSKDSIINMIYDETTGITFHTQKRVGSERSGTGDVFSAILAANAVRNVPFEQSVAQAGNFVREALIYTKDYQLPSTDGVYFEPLLNKLVTIPM